MLLICQIIEQVNRGRADILIDSLFSTDSPSLATRIVALTLEHLRNLLPGEGSREYCGMAACHGKFPKGNYEGRSAAANLVTHLYHRNAGPGFAGFAHGRKDFKRSRRRLDAGFFPITRIHI